MRQGAIISLSLYQSPVSLPDEVKNKLRRFLVTHLQLPAYISYTNTIYIYIYKVDGVSHEGKQVMYVNAVHSQAYGNWTG